MMAALQSAESSGAATAEGRPLVRVCFLIDCLSRAGTESQLLMLIRHLDRSRVSPYLCLLDGEDHLSRSLEPDDCPVLRLGIRSFRSPSTAAKALRFVRFLRRERIEVLQTFFIDSAYFGLVLGRLAGARRVIRTRNNSGYWMTPRSRRMDRIVSSWFDLTLTNCEAGRAALVGAGTAPESVAILPNGIESDRFTSIQSVRMGEAGGLPRRIGLVANLRPVKDPISFVRAAAIVARRHPDVEFHVAGDGELRTEMLAEARAGGIEDRLVLHGSVGDVPHFLEQLHVAVLSSASEGLSNAILEYMAAGRAVVATSVGAAAELIRDGVDGLLVPPQDPAALGQAVIRLLDEPRLAERLGREAKSRVAERFAAAARARLFEDLCRDGAMGSR